MTKGNKPWRSSKTGANNSHQKGYKSLVKHAESKGKQVSFTYEEYVELKTKGCPKCGFIPSDGSRGLVLKKRKQKYILENMEVKCPDCSRESKVANFNVKTFLYKHLRQSFLKSPLYYYKLSSWKKQGSKCEKCGAKTSKPEVDHIVPVAPLDGSELDFNAYIERLFCSPSNLQCLCSDCHKVKTNEQRSIRFSNKK
jgi:hypothetical protein